MPLPDVSVGSSGHITHHNVLHDVTQVDEQVRWVSKGGAASDSNDGLSQFLPKSTIQSAYDSLPSAGGFVALLPGRHDVGSTGLQLNRTKPVCLSGPGMWSRISGNVANWDTGGGTVLYSSTGTPSSLVSFPNPGSAFNGNGFEFHNVVFEVKSGMSYGINADSVNRAIVEDCAFHIRAPAAAGISLKHPGTLGDDASWWRIIRNTLYGGRLFESLETANHNQILIADNECIAGSGPGTTGPFITLKGGHRCVIRDNNLEADTVSVFMKLDHTSGSMTTGNGGEGGGGGGQIFCQLDASNGNLLMDMGVSAPAATDRLYDHINGSQDNLEITAAYGTAIGYSAAASTVFADSTTSQLFNSRITGGVSLSSNLWLPKVKSGSGAPNGVVDGWVGDLFTRSDGGAGTTLYIKESGNNTNTGWVAK